MKYRETMQGDALRTNEQAHAATRFHGERATSDLPPADDRVGPDLSDQRTDIDYSEEAIPERDPVYQLPDGTSHEAQTAEYVSAADRLALARCLEQLGIRPATAALVASL